MFATENNPRILYVVESLGLTPDYVKAANTITEADLSPLPATSFADVSRQYPIYNKVATFLSCIYALHDSALTQAVRARLEKAAAIYNIHGDVLKAQSALAKQASETSEKPQPKCALQVDFEGHGGLKVANFYPLDGETQIMSSIRALLNDFDNGTLPAPYFKTACAETMKAILAEGIPLVSVPDRIKEAGADRVLDFEKAAQHAAWREYAGVPADVVEIYKDLVKAAAAEGGDKITVEQAIEAFYDLDVAHGVKYSSLIADAHSVFYSGDTEGDITKMANDNVALAGVLVPAEVLANINPEKIAMHFSRNMACKIASICESASGNAIEASFQISQLAPQDANEFLRFLSIHG